MIDIFDLLLSKKELSPTSIHAVKKYCQAWSCSGYEGLIETHIYEESVLADYLAEYFQIDRVYSIFADASGDTLRRDISYKTARDWNCLPSLINPDNSWAEIILADPTQRQRIAYFREKYNGKVYFGVATKTDIRQAIDEYYQVTDFLPFLSQS